MVFVVECFVTARMRVHFLRGLRGSRFGRAWGDVNKEHFFEQRPMHFESL
jgi:hypothetical protein